MIRYYLVLIVTLLSLNSFAKNLYIKPFPANEAKIFTNAAKIINENDKIHDLFSNIITSADSGSCSVELRISDLPKNFKPLLIKLSYKLEYYEFTRSELISWCD